MHEETEKEFEKLIPKNVDILHEIKTDRIFCSRQAIVNFISTHFIDKRILKEELEKMKIKEGKHSRHNIDDSYCYTCSDIMEDEGASIRDYKYNQALQNIKDKLL